MSTANQPNPFDKFLLWEAASRDTIDFKKIYVDMAGDLKAGLMLSEIVYWYLPSKEYGDSKLRVEHDNHFWIACRRYEWHDRTRMSPYEADAALKVLKNLGLIITKNYKFNNSPTIHVRLNQRVFMERWSYILNNPPVNPYLPDAESDFRENRKTILEKTEKRNRKKSKIEIGENGKSLTEISPNDSAWITAWDGNAETLPAYISAIIGAWVKGWPGQPSGRPYANKTNRGDCENMLKRSITPGDVARYCEHLRTIPRWKESRPAFAMIVSDIDSWLEFNRLPNPTPAQQTEPPKTKANLAAVRENMERMKNGQTK